MPETGSTEKPSKLPLVIVGACVVVAVLITVVLVAIRGPATFEPGTPEATLQAFINAGLDADEDTLLALMTEESAASCRQEFDERHYGRFFYDDDVRAQLDEMEITGSRADATVIFRRSSSNDPFDTSTWSSTESFRLQLEAGEWRIDRAEWPHPFLSCLRASS